MSRSPAVNGLRGLVECASVADDSLYHVLWCRKTAWVISFCSVHMAAGVCYLDMMLCNVYDTLKTSLAVAERRWGEGDGEMGAASTCLFLLIAARAEIWQA